ncbi:rod-binding protein [Leptospira sp. GIMC2001]|uniref:rod-binding protein n=1 Tax=Leptospira sp. GIMC2001 TaxID=1513297 RepID=UPI0004A5C53E|nr:rod-binding protein [Leptospira sp. GIMC2001]AID56246.1 flagellar protein FlgJ [Leptospira sp. GIMC2001]WCL48080.1 rod-binding protein [Leptospira sp. GIMC2001]
MNDIFQIQDYSNRLQREIPGMRSLKNIEEMKNNGKSFEDYIKDEVNPAIQGKVSSSEVKPQVNIQDEINKDPYRRKLFDASVEFESMFVKMMLKEMKSSVSKTKMIHGGYAEEIFEDMLTDEQAKSMSKNNSIGLAEQIYSSLSVSLPPLKQ